MSPVAIGVLAISMSVDAFVASVGKGASARRPSLGHAVRTGMIFGTIEAITPLVGWAAGVAASRYVQQVDHWIAFALLAAVGSHMVLQAWSGREEEAGAAAGGSLWPTVLVALGTSLDAMAIGVSLAFLEVNIVVIALAIGAATLVMSSTGMLVGRFLGRQFGRVAEAVGGCALMGLGALILFEHLAAG